MIINTQTIKKLIYTLIGVAIVWLFVRYAFRWVAPFVLALLTARLMERTVKALMHRTRLKRPVAATICSVLFLAAFGAVIVLIVTKAAEYLGSFIAGLPEMLEDAKEFIAGIREAAEQAIPSGTSASGSMVQAAEQGFNEMLSTIPQKVSAWALSTASAVASGAPKCIMFIATYIISVFFISASYPQVSRFIMRQIPLKWHETFFGIKNDCLKTLGKWFKAQFIMMTITFAELSVSFLILHVPYSFLAAAAISVVDALPVLGTGTVLIPWAIIGLISGNTTLAIGLALTYGVTAVVRSVMEPRIVGGQIGLPAVATLMAIYIGYCTIGVWGMIFFPLGLMILKQLNDNGYIRLWK